MKKRIACLLLTLMMLVSLIPTAAITASAAGLAVSEAGIKVIKDYMGFKRNAYQVASGDYRIGYGTPSVANAVITEANADVALRQKLAELDAVVNTAAGSTVLVQNRHDALVWYSYTQGTGWTTNTEFVNAVRNETAGSAFANIMCTWDYKLSGYPDTAASKAVLTSRMAIANMYLYHSYSTASTGSLGYTVFDAVDGVFSNGSRKMVQVFAGTTQVAVSNPTWGASQFLGWYSNNALVTGVGSATAGQTLSAHWQTDSNKVPTSYTLPAYVIYEAAGIGPNDVADVYAAADTTSAKIDYIRREATVSVASELVVGGYKWLELSTGGWVRLCAVGATMPTIFAGITVTMTDDYVNIRENPSATAKKVGVAKRGETRTIVMIKNVGSQLWGYCSEGWFMLMYTSYYKNSGSTTANLGTATAGVVTGADRVNVRSGAGVGNNLVTTLARGTKINVYEQTTVGSASWGHIDQGWICMDYVTLDQQASPVVNNTATGSAVVVSTSASLNVRSGPGAQYTVVTTLAPGTNVVILQRKVVDGVTWAQIDQGWINMNYVSAASGSAAGTTASVSGIGGTVVNCSSGVNIRSAAGTNNALVGVAALGSRVTVSERTMVNGFYWGNIGRGWVCMDYIQLDSEFVDQNTNSNNNNIINNVVSSFAGYPAKTNAATPVRESASSDSKVLMRLDANVDIDIMALQNVGINQFAKVTIGNITGWVDMNDVDKKVINAKVTVEKANAYEQPSVRSQFCAALVKGTSVVIDDWQLEGSVLWGRTQLSGHIAWISMADVTMFRDNTLPTGNTSLSGAGYLSGVVTADTVVKEDKNGNVTTNDTIYTVVAGQKVNIQARNYLGGATWGKVTVGSVTGWIDMSVVELDAVEMKVTQDIKAYNSLADITAETPYTTILAGSKVTILTRALNPFTNSINSGLNDCGYVYVGDNTSTKYWIVLDEGKLSNVSAAAASGSTGVSVQAGVVVTRKALANITVYEEATIGSTPLVQLNSGSNVTILNWKLVSGETWGKVQVGNIVGWIQVNTTNLDFTGWAGTVSVDQLYVYARADVDSSVQILNIKNSVVAIKTWKFDGTTLWGCIDVAGKDGWINMSSINQDATGASVIENSTVIANGKINSVDAEADVNGEVIKLTKGTVVKLLKVKFDSGVAKWLVDLGTKDGWVKMDSITISPVTATITGLSAEIYDDLTLSDVLYTLYRNEKINVFNLMVSGGQLFGEVAYGETTGWIKIMDSSSNMVVSIAPGTAGSSYGTNSSSATTATTATTAPAETGKAAYVVCSSTVNVRSGAGTEYNLVTTLANGTAVTVFEEKLSSVGTKWGRISQGWICMDYIQYGTLPVVVTPGKVPTSGTAGMLTVVPSGAIAVGYANEDVKIRSGAALGYPEVGTIKKGYSVTIYEKKLEGGMSWGRVDQGWICISYFTLTGVGTSGTMGTIARCGFTANIRSNPNSASALMGKVMISSRVAVLEQSGGWARTDMGWISMDYIVLDTEAAPVGIVKEAAETVTAATTPTEIVIADNGNGNVG